MDSSPSKPSLNSKEALDDQVNEYVSDLMSKHSASASKQQTDLPFMGLAGTLDEEELQKYDRKNSLMTFNTPDRKLKRSESLFDPPQVSDLVIQKNQEQFKPDSAIFLKERGILKYKI